MNRVYAFIVAALAAVAFAGCESQADTVATNISKEAEKFNVQRRIVGMNGITGKVEFEVIGRCSIEGDGLGGLNALIATCKHGPTDYRKHYVGLSDNMYFISTQMEGINVSEYHTKIVLKPQGFIPDIDIAAG